eukprot:3724009-Rhodomonas_salina.1
MVVAEIHEVASHPETPVLAFALCCNIPSLPPTMVIGLAPKLIQLATDSTSDREARAPTDTTILAVAPNPHVGLHIRLVDDDHLLTSQAEFARCVVKLCPKLAKP